MSSPFDAVEAFQKQRRRSNPPMAMSGARLLEWMAEQGWEFDSFDEEDWRGMADQMGMDEVEAASFMENVAGYMA